MVSKGTLLSRAKGDLPAGRQGDLVNELLTSVVLLTNNFSGLVLSPYKTMRRISLQDDVSQIGLIFFLVFLYCYVVSYLTYHNLTNFIFFLISFVLTISFFYLSSRLLRLHTSLKSLVNVWMFSLAPTLMWFFLTFLLYLILPPPRTTSLLGTGFSVIYIGVSLSILLWKITLIYLGIRFALKTDFLMTLFLMIIYGVWFLPYSYALYFLSVSRVPFI